MAQACAGGLTTEGALDRGAAAEAAAWKGVDMEMMVYQPPSSGPQFGCITFWVQHEEVLSRTSMRGGEQLW